MRSGTSGFYHRHPQLCRRLLKEERIRTGLSLYPGKTKEEVAELLFNGLEKRILAAVVAACLIVLGGIVFLRQEKTEEDQILRPLLGETEQEVGILIRAEQEWQQETLLVGARELTEEELEQWNTKVTTYLEGIIFLENLSAEQIIGDLYLPQTVTLQLQDREYQVRLNWSSDHPELITKEGTLCNDRLLEACQVLLQAKISYGEEFRVFSKLLTVWPKEYTEQERRLLQIMEELQKQEAESRNEDVFVLPQQVAGQRIRLETKKKLPMAVPVGILAGTTALLLYQSYFTALEERRKKRRREAEQQYREFVSRLALLLAAGLSVRAAWKRLAAEYMKKQGTTWLAEELAVSERELSYGKAEPEVYEAFGNRMGMVCYRRLTSLLNQQVIKGVRGMQQLLLQEAEELAAQEKEKIRIRGQEAGTKLLFPMMGLLILVFAILIVPAIRSL